MCHCKTSKSTCAIKSDTGTTVYAANTEQTTPTLHVLYCIILHCIYRIFTVLAYLILITSNKTCEV